MVFYHLFVAFVGLDNNTIVAMQNIEFGSVSSDRYPDPAENTSIEAIPILNIGSAHHCLEHIWPPEKVLIYAFLKNSCHDTKDGQRATLCKCNAAQLKLEVTLLSLYLSRFLVLSFSPSLSKIDNSSRWVRMIESWLLLKMKIFADDKVVHEGFLKCSRKCSLSNTIWTGFPSTCPTHKHYSAPQQKQYLSWTRSSMKEYGMGGEGMREAVRKRKQRHEISSVSSTHLLYITAKPHSDIWPHSTCCSLCSLTISLSFTPCTIIYFCTIFVFYLSITLDIWGTYSLVKEAFADRTVKNYFLWTCPKPETPKTLLRL